MTRLTQAQLDVLQAHYTQSMYITIPIRNALSLQTGLTPMQVTKWFQSRRHKNRHLNHWQRFNPHPRQDDPPRLNPQPSQNTQPNAQPAPQMIEPVAQATVTRLTAAQTEQLEQLFAEHRYLSNIDANGWAERIGISRDKMWTWFKNRRTRRRQFEKERWRVRELEQFMDAHS